MGQLIVLGNVSEISRFLRSLVFKNFHPFPILRHLAQNLNLNATRQNPSSAALVLRMISKTNLVPLFLSHSSSHQRPHLSRHDTSAHHLKEPNTSSRIRLKMIMMLRARAERSWLRVQAFESK